MDANGIAMTASAAAALGFGASLGLKLAPAFVQARREAAALRPQEISEGAAGTSTDALNRPGIGAKAPSSDFTETHSGTLMVPTRAPITSSLRRRSTVMT